MTGANVKALGQHFTPPAVAQVLGALSLRRDTTRIVDPTCGNGQLLIEALRQFPGSGRYDVVGVELDRGHAVVAKRQLTALGSRARVRIVSDDVFQAAAGVGARGCRGPLIGFDAVIGNPPYVRYQASDAAGNHGVAPGSIDMKTRVAKRIRSCLLSSSLSRPVASLDELLNATEPWLAKRDAPEILDPLERDWIRLVTNYSGLADLALPVWLLSRALSKPGGVVGLVTTESIYNRMYGKLLRYFMLRFMEPVLTIRQEGRGWFPNAQVRAAVVVVRRRTDSAARMSLRERASIAGGRVPHVTLMRTANLATQDGFDELSRRLGLEPDLPEPQRSSRIASAMLEGKSFDGAWVIEQQTEQLLIQRLIDDLGGVRGELLTRLEGPCTRQVTCVSSGTMSPAHRYFTAVFKSKVPSTTRFVPLALLADVHQGLRTGCNRFFYVPATADAVHEWMRWRANETDRKSGKLASTSDSAVVSVSLPGIGRRDVPCAYLRPTIKSQGEARLWEKSGQPPTTFLVAAGTGTRAVDLKALRSLPPGWLAVWKTDGLHRLPQVLDEYISIAETWDLQSPSGPVRPFELSAVAPNVRIPDGNKHRSMENQPPMPSWWYSLTLKERHVAPVFVSRVNSESIHAFANHPRYPFVVDANFSTLTPNGEWSSHQLVAYLNTTMAAVWLERHATPMGGGALKVEAAHLRELPVPLLSSACMQELSVIGRRMTSQAFDAGGPTLSRQATEAVARGMLAGARTDRACDQAEEALQVMRTARAPRDTSSLLAGFEKSTSAVCSFPDATQGAQLA
jgi:hypothetical protein